VNAILFEALTTRWFFRVVPSV